MIKKILVALDPDSDTQTAIRHAIDIAKRYDGTVTGLAVVDMGSIASSTRGAGLGTMYYADKLKEKLTTEARESAQKLVVQFEKAVQKEGVGFSDMVQEGVPFVRIVEDMKYHDLLVVGNDPHFFYSHPKQATETLAKVVRKTVGPTLIVSKKYTPVKKVLVAYDGSMASAEAMRSFVVTKPFGTDLAVRLMMAYEDRAPEAELTLKLAAEFMGAHGFDVETLALEGSDPEQLILDQIKQFDADLVVAGAHSKSRIRAVAFGSTTEFLVKKCPVSLYLDS